MGTDGAWNETRALRWETLDRAGWEYLLPRRADARWLCLDAAAGATAALLADLCAQLTVVAPDAGARAEIGERLRRLGVAPARVVEWSELGATEAGFDGFVLHDLEGTLESEAVEHALDAAQALLSPDAFFYLALRNRYGYARAQRGWREYLPARTGRYFRPADFAARWKGQRTVVHPLISNAGGRVLDVIAPAGYVSAQNPSRRGERLRRALLGPRGAPLMAPAFALVAAPEAAPASTLGATLRELERRRGAAAGSFGVRRYHCLRGGKVVVSAGPAQGDGRSILVFARAPEAIARRQREFELLARLARLPAQISRQIPRPEYADEVAGARLFVLQEFSGVTLDAPVEGLETATREGAEFLARLHRATARRVRVAAADFEAVCGPMFEAARDRYPALAQALARARGALAAGLAGLEIPLVWLHGDFKVENLVVDARSSRLCGVIDWELSEPEGLPMLDLWYLLLYNRQIRDGTHFFPAVADLVPPRRLPGAEAALCGEYARALGLPEAATPALALALIVHHCARRVFYDNHDGARMASIAGTIEACVRWIERGAPPGARRDA